MKMVRKSLLDKFTRLGGYQIVKKTEDGRWKNIAEASRKTGISRPAIARLLSEHPEPPIKQLLLSEENYEKIRESYSQIKDVSKAFERIRTQLENSLVVDLQELRMRQELQGKSIESFQLALRKQVEAEEKKEGRIEKDFRTALQALHSAVSLLGNAVYQIQDL
jgi:hypothetical protein